MAVSSTLAGSLLRRWRLSPWGLYVAGFFFAAQVCMMFVSIPWQIMRLGGSSLAVGAGGMSMAVYIFACILVGHRIDRLGTKRVAIFGAVASTLLIVCMPFATSVTILLVLVALQGAVCSCFWPPLMGWVSAGSEGKRLNRRLGIWNMSWSLGDIVGFLAGGVLFGLDYRLPFFIAAACAALACAMLIGLRGRRTLGAEASADEEIGSELLGRQAQLKVFKNMSRLAILSIYVMFGAIVVPLSLLIKEMSLGPDIHGTVEGGVHLILLLSFLLLGWSHGWHFRLIPLLGVQAVAIVCLCVIPGITAAGSLIALTMIAAPAIGISYCSHLYYGVSGGAKRAHCMAIHETLLAVGFAVGSIGGGALAGLVGIRPMFYYIAALACVSIAAQIVIYSFSRIAGRK